jgi:hypothetical protein
MMKTPASTVVLVLGQILEKDKSLPNTLINRVNKAISIWKNDCIYECKYMLLSGGDAAGLGVSEASAMRRFIIDQSPELCGNIMLEEKSMNTVENALYCKDVLEKVSCSCLHLVTNEFHMPRARCIFECVMNHDPPMKIKIECHPAESGFEAGIYRRMEDRPQDPKRWRLCERLDWEVNALTTLNEYLSKYCLGPLDDDRIQKALEEVRKMNVTLI